ncbi:flagellar hook-basal body complex protein FliE [Alkalicoccobacillus murimartini]|uniref:Flagellar hook-basal body complex protein FliE n=1 Tax=Alkalicoccobacillus murimartini TaxID=171685 RepID=A0ABT9YER8_9BACI|nr:flagellar hook-basal body complex protein FliE [Alkalicoccobacillus murimartini]MDQ0206348.1 flagellar hook-basal body complex protein FliE [Alkalicoccobacillus murimartini]
MDPISLQSPFNPTQGINPIKAESITPGEAQASFKAALSNALSEVNTMQNESSKKTEDLALGKPVELHDVMITGQKASVSLQATIEVRNKVVEAYQEIMRMQV